MSNSILYDDIPKYCDQIDNRQRSTVVLSKFQVRLFKNLVRDDKMRLGALAYFVSQMTFIGRFIIVLVFARYLVLLTHFYRRNHFDPDLIHFEDLDNGKVAVTFNPYAEPNVGFD